MNYRIINCIILSSAILLFFPRDGLALQTTKSLEEVQLLLRKADNLKTTNDKRACDILNEVVELAQRNGHKEELANAYQLLFEIKERQDSITLSLKYGKLALELFQSLEDLLKVKEIGRSYEQLLLDAGYTNEAEKEAQKLLMLARESSDSVFLARILLDLSIIVSNNDLPYSNQLAQQSFTVAYTVDKPYAPFGLNMLAVNHKNMGQTDSAIYFYDKALELLNEDQLWLEGVINENLGILYNNLGQFQKALQAYYHAIAAYEKEEDERSVHELYSNIGLIFKKNGEYGKALGFYKKTLGYLLSKNRQSNIHIYANNIASVFLESHQVDSALYYLRIGQKSLKKSNTQCHTGFYSVLGRAFLEMNAIDSAKYYLEKDLAHSEACGENISLSENQRLLGLVYWREGDLEKAREYYQNAYEIAIQIGNLEPIKKAARVLYEYHKTKSNTIQALKYFEVYKKTDDSLFNQESTRKLAWLEANQRMKQVTDSLGYHRAMERQQANQEIALQKQRSWIIFLSAISGLILVSLYFIYMRKNRQLAYQRVLQAEKEKGFNSVIQATEEERSRISKDLHDGIGQQLSGLKLGLNALSEKVTDEHIKSQLQEITASFSQSADEVRHISHQMMPRALAEKGLIVATEELLKNAFQFSDTKFQLEHDGINERLPERIEISIYRVIQELVNNIIKHARASQVNVQLIRSRNQLMIFLEDDGKGFDHTIDLHGHGLLNIKSRVDMIKGTVNFEPGPHSGTFVSITIPIEKHA